MIAPLSVSSTIGGIAWPGIPASSGASLLAFLFQLEQSQWWSPPEISRKQRDQLKVLLDHARAHVPFYRERLRDLGGLPADESWHQVWRRITPLTRAEIQAADATGSMITEMLPPGHGELREIYTSGSTGRPIRSIRTQLWELMWSAFTVRDHLWHRRDLGGVSQPCARADPAKLFIQTDFGPKAGAPQAPQSSRLVRWSVSMLRRQSNSRSNGCSATTPITC